MANRPLWTNDHMDIESIKALLGFIQQDMGTCKPGLSREQLNELQQKLLFWFELAAACIEHARGCLLNGGPEEGWDKVLDAETGKEFDPVFRPMTWRSGDKTMAKRGSMELEIRITIPSLEGASALLHQLSLAGVQDVVLVANENGTSGSIRFGPAELANAEASLNAFLRAYKQAQAEKLVISK